MSIPNSWRWYWITSAAWVACGASVFAQQTPPSAKSSSQLSDNPFESTEVIAKYPSEMKNLSGRPSSILEGKLSSLDQQLEYDLGKLRADSEHLIEFRLINDLGISLEFDQISASFGCIGGLPKDVQIESGKSIPIRVAFKVPNDQDTFGRTITLVDRKHSIATKILLKGESTYTCQFAQNTFPATQPGRHTFETDVEFPFDRVDRLKFRFDSPEIAGWRVIPTGEHTGHLVFDVVFDGNDNVDSIVRLHIRGADHSAIGTVPIRLIRGFKPATRPSTIILRDGERGLFGRVVVQFPGLIALGSRSTVELAGTANPKHGDSEPIEFKVRARLTGGKDLLTLAELEIEDERVRNQSNDYDLSVLFTVGDQSLRVPMTILSGEEK